MKKSIIIVGMGPGLSLGVAEKFGQEGFAVGMISRNAEKLKQLSEHLAEMGIESVYAAADVADTDQLTQALGLLSDQLNGVHVLHYNAVDARMKPLMEETVEDLTKGFKISVANALAAVRFLLPQLKLNKGAVLLTGGGTANYPNPDMATISLGKAGIRNLAYQLHQALAKDDVFVGTVTVGGWINPQNPKHAPKVLADIFWDVYVKRDPVETVH